MQKFISKSGLQTRKFAERIAGEILITKNQERAFVLGLVGDLGVGKTTFVAGLGRALGAKGRMLSPTFLIMRKHAIASSRTSPSFAEATAGKRNDGQYNFLYHIDAYRLNNFREILDLGWEKIVADKQNIVVVEWADKIKDLMPKNTLWINFEHGENEKTRSLHVLE